MTMKPWHMILTGWLTFLTGHAIIVAIRARILATYLDFGQPSPVPRIVFYTIDGAILAVASLMIILGTLRMLSQPRWRLLLVLLLLMLQFAAAYIVFLVLTFTVHMGVGGPV